MSFDKEYNKIIHHQINEDIDFSWAKKAFDWTNGKIKDGINWSAEKIQNAAKYLFDNFSQDNSNKIQPMAKSLINNLPSDYKSKYNEVLQQAQSKEFKKYYWEKISQQYTKQQYNQLSFSEKKNLQAKILEEYNKTLVSENIIVQAWLILIRVIIWLVTIITGIFGIGEGIAFVRKKWDENFGSTDNPNRVAKNNQTKRDQAEKQHQFELKMSRKQQDALNLALAN